MKKVIILSICALLTSIVTMAQTKTDTTITLQDVSVVSYYRSSLNSTNQINRQTIQTVNRGQEPSLIFNGLPSVYATSDAGNGYGYSYFRIRGMDQTRINATLDGIPLNEGEDFGAYYTNYPDLLGSIQSVQISNGSNITNNGSAAYAGSVNYESIDLLKNHGSSVFLGYGSDGTYRSAAEYNSGLKGKWAFHVHGTAQGTDGYRDHAYNRSQSIFLKIGYFINKNNSIDFLSFMGKARNGQAYLGATYGEMKEYGRRYNPVSDEESDRFMQNINKLQYKSQFSDNVTFMSSVYWNHLKGDYYATYGIFNDKDIRDVDLLHDMIGGNAVVNANISNLNLTGGINGSWFTRRHRGMPKYLNDDVVRENTPSDNLYWNNRGYKTDADAFIKAKYSFNNGLILSGSIQYRHAAFDYKGKGEAETEYNTLRNFKTLNWNFVNWSGAAKYLFNSNNSAYASVTRTHREPTRTNMFGGNEYWLGTLFSSSKAEAVTDYELGYNFNANTLSGNINLFYMNFDDEYVLNGEIGENSLSKMEMVDDSYRMGVELNATWKPISSLSFTNSTSWSRNKVNGKDKKGNSRDRIQTMSPSWTVMQNAEWHNNHLAVGAEMLFRSKMYIDLANTYNIPSSLKFNLYASVNINKNVQVRGRLDNIFNKSNFCNGTIRGDQSEGYGLIAEARRTYFVDLAWKF